MKIKIRISCWNTRTGRERSKSWTIGNSMSGSANAIYFQSVGANGKTASNSGTFSMALSSSWNIRGCFSFLRRHSFLQIG